MKTKKLGHGVQNYDEAFGKVGDIKLFYLEQEKSSNKI